LCPSIQALAIDAEGSEIIPTRLFPITPSS
jgi:hypothetical protein